MARKPEERQPQTREDAESLYPGLKPGRTARRYLTTSDGPGKATIGRWVEIDDRGYVDGETPIEDYPFYLLTDHPVYPSGRAWEVWISAIRDAEIGSDPEE